MSSFSGTFSISYKDYCENNNLETPPQEMIDMWREQAIYNYEKQSPVDMVMNLFKIPENLKKAVEYHEYEINDTGYNINNNKKILTVFMELTITR